MQVEGDAVKLNSFALGREMVGLTRCRDHAGSHCMELNLIRAMQYRRTWLLKAHSIPCDKALTQGNERWQLRGTWPLVECDSE